MRTAAARRRSFRERTTRGIVTSGFDSRVPGTREEDGVSKGNDRFGWRYLGSHESVDPELLAELAGEVTASHAHQEATVASTAGTSAVPQLDPAEERRQSRSRMSGFARAIQRVWSIK